MNFPLPELWKKTRDRLEQLIAPQTFKRWLDPIEPSHMEESCVCLRVANHIYQYWLEDNYGDLLRETMSAVAGKPLTFRFLRNDEAETKKSSPTPPEPWRQPARGRVRATDRSNLNPDFTFNNFVVGPSNQYAHAGCWAVAQSPGRTYNPLFIHGATGLGKTHLMHAVGHHLISQSKSCLVAYVSTERFVNEFIDAIQNKKFSHFRRKYRECDILLVDDIHFLGKGEQMQEEFFHTFNTLFEGQKQIVLSSDRPASEIANLEQRLVSRFEWGLTVELLVPDQETRVAILRRKQQSSDVPISDEVLEFLAGHIKTNIRRLEGAWAKVWFTTKLKNRLMTIPEVQEILHDILLEESRQALTAETIQKRVASYFDIRLADMTSKRRNANIAFPRQVAMYLCRTMTQASLNEIGESFGGKDHGTVLHACRLIEERMKSDGGLKQAVGQLTKQLMH